MARCTATEEDTILLFGGMDLVTNKCISDIYIFSGFDKKKLDVTLVGSLETQLNSGMNVAQLKSNKARYQSGNKQPGPRAGHGLYYFDEKCILFGGFKKQFLHDKWELNNVNDGCFYFSIKTDTWYELPVVSEDPKVLQRSLFASCLVHRQKSIFFCGGLNVSINY